MGDRSLSAFPVAMSLMASFLSAISLLGVCKEHYVYGTQFVVINFSYGLATPIAAYWFLPVFFKLQATSAYHVCNQFTHCNMQRSLLFFHCHQSLNVIVSATARSIQMSCLAQKAIKLNISQKNVFISQGGGELLCLIDSQIQ